MKTTEILVENIKCHGCANTIKREVSKLENVSEVNVDVEKGAVAFTHPDETSPEETVAVRLRQLGYPLQGTGGTGSKVKSYVSCAIGRITPDS
jgi:copper chaperone CopZ